MCDFMSGRKSSRSQLGVQYFDEFRTHFWGRPEDEFDRVRSINTFNRRRSRGSGNIILRRQSPSVGRRRSLPVRQRRLELPPVSLLTNNDYIDISIDTEHIKRNVGSLSIQPPPSYDIATTQESSNVNIQ
ncbi:unnamed protein product [Rhizophagus irregularis]|nr:unnamed protein product [Rhizophagus irregularis]